MAFSLPLAFKMATCSALAYKHPDEVRKTDIPGLLSWEFLQALDNQAYALRFRNHLVIAFRGTEKALGDILRDLKAWRTVGIHTGFLEGFNELHALTGLRDIVEGFEDGPVYLTGHSLGAALATVAASRYASTGIQALYTFGSPHVGDEDFVESLDEVSVYRVVNNNDIVPRLLDPSPFYDHAGDLWYLGEDGELFENPGWFRLAWEAIEGRVEDFGELGTDGAKDHSIAEYVDALGRLIGA